MSEKDTVAVVFWADDTWQYMEDYNLADYAHMSDDTIIMYLPDHLESDQIDGYVRAFNRGERGQWTAC